METSTQNREETVNVQAFISDLYANVSETAGKIREQCPEWLPHLRLAASLLPYALNIRPSTSARYGECAPQLSCADESEWREFITLKPRVFDAGAREADAGAREAGAFVVDLPQSIVRGYWTAPPVKPSVTWKHNTLTRAGHGMNSLTVQHYPGFEYDIRQLRTCPRHQAPQKFVDFVLDAFEERVTAAMDTFEKFDAPPYATNLDANTKITRERIGLRPDSAIAGLGGSVLPQTRDKYPGVHDPEAFISSPGFGAPFGAHQEDFNLEAMNMLVAGMPKVWYIIPERDAAKFERLICEEYGIKPACSQFVRHHYSFPTRAALAEIGINPTIIYQQQGQVVITLSRCYHFGFSLGANLAEALNYGDGAWSKEGYIGCHQRCGAGVSAWITHEGLEVCSPRTIATEESRSHGTHTPERSGSTAASSSLSSAQSTPCRDSEDREADVVHESTEPAGTKRKRKQPVRETRKRTAIRNRKSTSNAHVQATDEAQAGASAVSDALVDYGAQERAKRDRRNLSRSDRFIDADQLRKKLVESFGASPREIELVMRLYYAVGSVDSVLMLKEILNSHRQQTLDQVVDRQGIPPSERRQILDGLDRNIARCGLLKRCHLVRLCEDLGLRAPRNAFVVQTSANMRVGSCKRKGNPVTAAAKDDTSELVGRLYPGAERASGGQVGIRASANSMRIACVRYKLLVDRFGFGILALIPATGGGSLNVSDAM